MFSSKRSSFSRSSPTTASFKSQFTVRPVPAGLNGQQLKSYVILTLNQVPSISPNTQFITRVDRLGAFERESTAVITCTDPTTRNVFLSSKKHIHARTGFISDAYLTAQQQQNRNAVAHYYLLLKSWGYKPHWRVDKLCYMRDGKSATFSPFSIFGQKLLAGIVAKPGSTPSTGPPPQHASTTTQAAPSSRPSSSPAPPPPPPPPPSQQVQTESQPKHLRHPQHDAAPTNRQPQPAPVHEDNIPTTSSAPVTTNPQAPLEKEPPETSQDSLQSSQTAAYADVPHDSTPSSPSTASLCEASTTVHLTGQLLGLKHAILSYSNHPYRITGLPDNHVAPLQQVYSVCLDTISKASQFHPHMDSHDLQKDVQHCISALLDCADYLESHKDIDQKAASLFRKVVVTPFTNIFQQFPDIY